MNFFLFPILIVMFFLLGSLGPLFITPAESSEYEVNFDWENVSEKIKGWFIPYPLVSASGFLTAEFKGIPCSGYFIRSSGSFRTDPPVKGTWTLRCKEEISVEGTFESYKLGTGTGIGTDNKGRDIKIKFDEAIKSSKNKTKGNITEQNSPTAEQRLRSIKRLLDQGIISPKDAMNLRKKVLSQI